MNLKRDYLIFSVDCKWGPWSKSQCNATCGNSYRNKTRQIVRKSAYGGQQCSGKLNMIEDCKLNPCPGKHLPHRKIGLASQFLFRLYQN